MNRIWLTEREGGDLRVEAVARVGDHLIAALHDPERRAERAPGGVLEGLSRLEGRLLADDAGTADFLDVTGPVSDEPVACQQLHRLGTVVGNGDGIEEEPLALRRVRS